MEIHVMVQTYSLYGGNTSLSLIGQYLADGAPDFGPAIKELTVTMHFAHSPPPKKSLEGLFNDFHTSLAKLPRVIFRRSREQASVAYQSTLLDGRDLYESRELSLALFTAGLAEVVERLSMLRPRLKPSDAFDLPGFLAHCERRLAAVPKSQTALELLAADLKRKDQEAIAQLSPWDKLGLDWRDFHPAARSILDDPFYWSSNDDFSPNGNDTGADVLGLYGDWIKHHRDRPATEFLSSLMRQWGIAVPATSQIEEDVYSEACVGLAFAEFKLRGKCDLQIAALAKSAVVRQRAMAEAASNWPHRDERLHALDRIEAKL